MTARWIDLLWLIRSPHECLLNLIDSSTVPSRCSLFRLYRHFWYRFQLSHFELCWAVSYKTWIKYSFTSVLCHGVNCVSNISFRALEVGEISSRGLGVRQLKFEMLTFCERSTFQSKYVWFKTPRHLWHLFRCRVTCTFLFTYIESQNRITECGNWIAFLCRF